MNKILYFSLTFLWCKDLFDFLFFYSIYILSQEKEEDSFSVMGTSLYDMDGEGIHWTHCEFCAIWGLALDEKQNFQLSLWLWKDHIILLPNFLDGQFDLILVPSSNTKSPFW